MTEDSKRLLYIIRYAGSDAGKSAADDLLIELRALRRVADAARDIVRGYPSYPSWGRRACPAWRARGADGVAVEQRGQPMKLIKIAPVGTRKAVSFHGTYDLPVYPPSKEGA